MKNEVITLGAGCFWCIEAVFKSLKGVSSVESGFSGGNIKNPSYREVCTGRTGHAEVINVEYDSNIIKLGKILEIFWQIHDPTTLNRQGGDVGTAYRSAIFYHNEDQKSIAELSKKAAEQSGIWKDPIVTEITEFTGFYKADDTHNDYYNSNIEQPYCQMVIRPKMDKFKTKFSELLNS